MMDGRSIHCDFCGARMHRRKAVEKVLINGSSSALLRFCTEACQKMYMRCLE